MAGKGGVFYFFLLIVLLAEFGHGFSTNGVIPKKQNAFVTKKPVIISGVDQRKVTELKAWGGNSNAVANALLSDSSLKQYFLETLISVGVPAAVGTLVSVIIIKTAMGSSIKKREYEDLMKQRAEQNELLSDLLGDNSPDNNNNGNWFSSFRGNNNQRISKSSPKNQPQYFKITPLHDMYRSYNYTMTSAISSTALANFQYQTSQYQQALDRIQPPITPQEWKDLQEEEEEYCKVAYPLQQQIQQISSEIQQLTLNNFNNTSDKSGFFSGFSIPGMSKDNSTMKGDGKLWTQYMSLQKEMVQLDLEFQTALLEILGTSEERINSVQLLTSNVLPGAVLGRRPLERIFQTSSAEGKKKTVYVLEFDGDVTASQVDNLREEVSSILVKEDANKNEDSNMEVVLKLSSPGGTVTGYGLAAAQLTRLRERNIPLTICVEQVAASGGYMMCCVGDRIIASPLAVLGSIGVISDLPNFYQRLKQEGIEFQTVTAGKYKRTLTPTKKVTKEDLDKSKQELEGVLDLFKGFVHKYRPQLDIDNVATGETWFGEDALRQKLCDSIATFDDTIAHYILKENANVYKIEYNPPMPSNPLLANLQPATFSRNPLRNLVRSFVQMVKEEISAEATTMIQQERNPKNSIMARSDDRYSQIRMQKEDNEFYF